MNITGHDNIGIGGDYDGVDRYVLINGQAILMYYEQNNYKTFKILRLPQGLEDVSKYQDLFVALQKKNPQRWTVENLKKLGHQNLIRVLAEAEKVHKSFIFT